MRNVHYVLSTHWDREWYQPFQDFRARLVQLIDRLLEGWESGALKGPFQTDGQAIILSDYLEVRPEKRATIERLVREGKFIVGPWYVLPDEFLVSGESLVRNIRMGRDVVRQYGAVPSNAGFLCDMFGHNSQMPQIFNLFGIPGAFLWRGTNLFDRRRFMWIGADGTRLPTYRFGQVAYCTYAVQMRGADLRGIQPDAETLEKRLDAWLADENAKTDAGPLLAFDGGDHMEWDQEAYKVLEKRFGKNVGGYKIQHTNLDAWLNEMLPTIGNIKAELKGELRDPGLDPTGMDQQVLIPGVTSSRVNIKQQNAYCQDVLCQWAEPFSAAASLALGREYPKGFLDVAWRWLIENHPHDSICGCSLDQVHRDMLYRFSQTQQIGDRVTREALRHITAAVAGTPTADEVRVGVFNPLPVEINEVVDLALDLPANWPTFNGMSILQDKYAFTIHASDGSELPYQRNKQINRRNRTRTFPWFFPEGFQVNVAEVSLPLRIPALGYTVLTIRSGQAGIPTRYPMVPDLAVSERTLENRWLRVDVAADGTLTVTDKSNGEVYERMLTFEDTADIGDGWNWGPAVSDQAFLSAGCHTSVAVTHRGRYKACLRIRTTMETPAEFNFSEMQRSCELAKLVIDSTVTLRADAREIEVETLVKNNVRDHRLKVLFPSGADTDTYLADTPFDVVERKIALREGSEKYREPEIAEKPQQTFSAVFDKKRGVAVAATGLLEAGVLDQPARTLGLTLFRATRQTVGTNGEPEGQMTGDLHFRYWIRPLQGDPDRVALVEMGQKLSGGVRIVNMQTKDVESYKGAKEMPAQAGFLSLSGAAVLTSLRFTEAGLEARVYNPQATAGKVSFDLKDWPADIKKPGKAGLVNLESKPLGKAISVRGGKVSFEIGAKQILTVLFA